jgi:hypothetical protein
VIRFHFSLALVFLAFLPISIASVVLRKEV